MRRRRERVLATILFTDIVRSSSVLAEIGDSRWQVLLAHHHAAVRTALRRHAGREVDTAGDGFFAVFDDQEAAIRCGCEIVEAVRPWGIEVRAGLTAGQVERAGRAVGGMAVHVGARIMGRAGAGEVLVSGVLRDLVAGAALSFEDRGVHRLKGIPSDVHLYAVRAVDGKPVAKPLTPEEAARRQGSITAPPAARPRPRRFAAAAVVLAAVIGAGAIVEEHLRGDDGPRFHASSVAEIDPRTGRLLQDVHVVDPAGTTPAATPGRQLATFSYAKQLVTMVRVSGDTLTRAATINTADGSPNQVDSAGLAVSAGWLWVANAASSVIKINTNSNTVAATYRLPGVPQYVADVGGVPWVFCHSGRIFRYDASDDRFHPMPVRIPPPAAVAVGEHAAWVATEAHTVERIAAVTGTRTVYQLPDGVNGLSGITVAFHAVWVASLGQASVPQTLAEIDPSTKAVRTVDVGAPVAPLTVDVAAAGDSLWIAAPTKHEIVQIDPTTLHIVHRYHVPYVPRHLLAAYGRLWVVVSGY